MPLIIVLCANIFGQTQGNKCGLDEVVEGDKCGLDEVVQRNKQC